MILLSLVVVVIAAAAAGVIREQAKYMCSTKLGAPPPPPTPGCVSTEYHTCVCIWMACWSLTDIRENRIQPCISLALQPNKWSKKSPSTSTWAKTEIKKKVQDKFFMYSNHSIPERNF